VVDDEEYIRNVMSGMLGFMDWDVVEASDPDEALLALLKGDRFDLVVTDLNSPRYWGGVSLLQDIKKLMPSGDMKVVLCSGSLRDEPMQNYREYGFDGAIEKPVYLSKLTDALNILFPPKVTEFIEQGAEADLVGVAA
jgi:CheY-like chemotaxis protein